MMEAVLGVSVEVVSGIIHLVFFHFCISGVPPLTDNELRAVKKRFLARKSFRGNLEIVVTPSDGLPEAVQDHAKKGDYSEDEVKGIFHSGKVNVGGYTETKPSF
jgi:hypothetical protein